jgi:hypothetical protein
MKFIEDSSLPLKCIECGSKQEGDVMANPVKLASYELESWMRDSLDRSLGASTVPGG